MYRPSLLNAPHKYHIAKAISQQAQADSQWVALLEKRGSHHFSSIGTTKFLRDWDWNWELEIETETNRSCAHKIGASWKWYGSLQTTSDFFGRCNCRMLALVCAFVCVFTYQWWGLQKQDDKVKDVVCINQTTARRLASEAVCMYARLLARAHISTRQLRGADSRSQRASFKSTNWLQIRTQLRNGQRMSSIIAQEKSVKALLCSVNGRQTSSKRCR